MRTTKEAQTATKRGIDTKKNEEFVKAVVLESMEDHVCLLEIKAAAWIAVAVACKWLLIIGMLCYFFSKEHFIGGICVCAIAVLYDRAQRKVSNRKYTDAAILLASVICIACIYMLEDGKAIHLCGVLTILFLLRIIKLHGLDIAGDIEEILKTRNELKSHALPEGGKLVVVTASNHEYTYSWDEEEIAKCLLAQSNLGGNGDFAQQS